jgi:predicted ATPase/class 3 adenylate cyclase
VLVETFTFLFTDIEGSTALVRRLGEGLYTQLLTDHHRLIRAGLAAHGGEEVDTQENAFFAVFSSPGACVAAALEMQRALEEHGWPGGEHVRARMGVHTGEAERTATGLVGLEVHRAARVAAVGYGGQVLVSEAAAALVRGGLAPGVSVQDLGVHRLKDLGRPERIFQLQAPGLQGGFPPLRSLGSAALPNNLPAQLAAFIGRGRELAEVRALVASSRLVTLTGAGGCGKTRLALQVAAELLDGSGDGVWLAELAAVTGEEAVAPAICRALGITARPGLEVLLDVLAPKDMLIVLDNCEHLIGGCAKTAEAILRGCPRVALLATSREPLRIGGEAMYRVPSLSLPAPGDTGLLAAESCDAVALFADRARAQGTALSLDEQTAPLVVSICARLDGLPLAIELAAARLRSLSLRGLAGRLDQRFRLLTGGDRTALARQQTLQATVEWSYALLHGVEQSLLQRLSVFAGSFDLAAAEAVCGPGDLEAFDVDGLLGSLVDKSLVVAEPAGDTLRYRLLETIRQFGEQRLEAAGETGRWRARHAGYYTGLLQGIREHAFDPYPEVFWAVRLGAEQDNLLAAWSRALRAGDVGTVFAILAGFAPAEVWTNYLLLLDGEAALELPGAAEHPGYPLALAVSAVFASLRGDVTGTEQLCRRAAEANARRDPPDWRAEETICSARSSIATTRGAFTDAARFAEQAAGIARAGGDLADTSAQLTLAVADHAMAGDAPAAAPLANEALALARQSGAPALIATGLLAVGATVAGTDPGQARACLRESRELSTALGYQSPTDLIWATGIAFLVGDRAATLEFGLQVIRALQRGGDRRRMGLVLHIIAGALAAARPGAAAIIQGAAETYVVKMPMPDELIGLAVTAAVGEERARELRAYGAGMDWDQAVAYTLTQTSQALDELESETQP